MTAWPVAPASDPSMMTVKDLLAYIASRFQEARRREFPELIMLARKVERVHRQAAEAPLGLADALDRFALELDLHMEVEERVLFPAMLRNMDSAIAHPIALMRSEHEGYEADIAKVEELTRGFSLPQGACGSWRRLYHGVARLCAELREQIRIENDILFPRFEVRATSRCTCAHG